jgi:arsenate reductase
MEKKAKVLFLSTGNSTRSQIAEGFLHAMADDQFAAASAGIEPGGPDPVGAEVMKETGIEMGQHVEDVKQAN